MKYQQYTEDCIPFVPDVCSYRDEWIVWWSLCQLAWRWQNEWLLPRDNAITTNWGKVGAHGQSGLFLIIMLTTWWAQSIESESNWAQFDKAVDDVQWVVDQIIDLLKAILAPLAPPPSGTSQVPIPSLGATWMSHHWGQGGLETNENILSTL